MLYLRWRKNKVDFLLSEVEKVGDWNKWDWKEVDRELIKWLR